MSRTVRLILTIAFIIFVGAIIWVVVATRDHKKTETKNTNTTNTPTLVGTPAVTTAPAVTAPAPAVTTPPVAPAKKSAVRYRTIITDVTTEESSSSAWASAGTNADGSAWAEAHAE